MKKILLFLVMAMLLPTLFLYGQNKQKRPTAELMNEKTTPNVLLGRINSANTSRELILLDPRLVAQQVDCSVAGYSFSMSAGNKYYGPVTVTGPKLTPEIKQTIVDWDMPGVTVFFKDIQLKCNGQESAATPIVLKYDH
jgi:hypothetical protein